MVGGLNGALEPARPHPQSLNVLLGNVIAQRLGVFPSAIAEVRVTSDSAVEIHDALAVPCQIDGARHDVDVHEVVDDARLYVALVFVHQHLLAGVVDFHKGQVALVFLVQLLVLFPVVLDAQHKVRQYLLFVHVRVVGTAHLNLRVNEKTNL